ncbi:hypothetical protein ATI61_11928 [Archangium gephyra]|uniref:Lipoprotein n=1 Tax=Archangium gephyra TaxID=48 RepID=A0AAC8Q9Y7_9BACT|nr:DUF6748 domain-containing protein [Archangium gephyra]AKJ03723.1 Hypothetical protein AA314_05349 [Archangium gephyra]REG22498.1 hypothetical protein ATI61_11928 [Archangium gephyra]
MRKLLCAFLVFGVSACGPDGNIFDDLFHDASEVHGPGHYRISDSGVRCAQAPCPTLRVSQLDSRTEFLVSGIEFPADMTQDKRQQATELIHTRDGLVAHGAPRGEGDARVFVVQSLLER